MTSPILKALAGITLVTLAPLAVIAAAIVIARATTPVDHSVRLSPSVSRVCDGPRAIYETTGQWTTTHTFVENDPACLAAGGSN